MYKFEVLISTIMDTGDKAVLEVIFIADDTAEAMNLIKEHYHESTKIKRLLMTETISL